MGEAAVEGPTQVDHGCSNAEAEAIACDASVPDAAVSVGAPKAMKRSTWGRGCGCSAIPVQAHPISSSGGEQLLVAPQSLLIGPVAIRPQFGIPAHGTRPMLTMDALRTARAVRSARRTGPSATLVISPVGAPVTPVVAPVVSPVLSSVDAMVHDGRSADDSRGAGNGCSDDARAGGSCWS